MTMKNQPSIQSDLENPRMKKYSQAEWTLAEETKLSLMIRIQPVFDISKEQMDCFRDKRTFGGGVIDRSLETRGGCSWMIGRGVASEESSAGLSGFYANSVNFKHWQLITGLTLKFSLWASVAVGTGSVSGITCRGLITGLSSTGSSWASVVETGGVSGRTCSTLSNHSTRISRHPHTS